ncbi:MAG: hypothetical protein M0Q95_08575 [Porticoccaceae bacterium]|nr:hypothetical protein [Porticoccaceae bacterium]
MRIFRVGDSQKVICEHCGSLESATFKLRDVPFSDGSGIVKKVLVGVCDCCDEVCVIPHQSTPAVRRQLECQRKAVESRLPAHLLDILGLATSEVGATADFIPSLVKYYIHQLATDPEAAGKLKAFLRTELAAGKADKRLSLKGKIISEELELVKSAADIDSTTDVIKGIILKINEDILLLKRPEAMAELKGIVAAVA